MRIVKWHRHLELFVWQHKRSIVLITMFGAAWVLSLLLFAPAASPMLSLALWSPEHWYMVIVGFFICVAVVIVSD